MKAGSKIALGMIVKNDTEAEMLDRCLSTVAPYVDGIFITGTQEPLKKIEKVTKKYGAMLDKRSKEFNHKVTKKEVAWVKKNLPGKPAMKVGDTIFKFNEARNANLDFIPDAFDWMFWMDTDDILRNGNLLRDSMAQAEAQGAEAIFYNYLYEVEFDENKKIKNVIIQHLRERMVKIKGDYRKVWKWIGNIHETLIQQRETKKIEDSRIDVLHLSNRERFTEALKRNMSVLEHEVFTTKGKDPRPLYYLAKACYDLHTPEAHAKAEKLIMRYLSPEDHDRKMSGWPQERSQAWEYLAEIYRGRKQVNKSIQALHNALIEYPQFPSTYFSLAISHMVKEEYDTARFWAIAGSRIPPARSTLVSNPRDTEARAYEIIYNAGIKLNKIDEAWAACQRLVELFPGNQGIQQQWQFINETREIRDQLKNYTGLVNYLNRTGQSSKIRPLLSAAPQQLENNPLVEKLRQNLFPPKDWGDKEIAIYCGPQFTPWSPDSISEPGGSFVGGSEEAVIYLSEELAKLGYKVVVYADPPEQKVYGGVEYMPHYKFNVRDNFNILIYWRAVAFIDMGCSAKKTYLWSHDVQNQAEYTKERLDKLTNIIVLSKAHRENLPEIPDNKFLISSNGYSEHFPKVKPKNNPKWAIWTSSYDRGLEHLLAIWPDVIKEVPDAQLHIFYGWQLFRHFHKNNPERMAWMKKMEKLMQQKGITHHGRVNQLEMEKWYKKCGIFAYPSHFYEINCISAIKAQLWGAVPVVIDYAALKETVKYGKKVEGDIWEPDVKKEYTKALIEAFKDEKWQEEQRKKMMPWSRKKYNWKEVAKSWQKHFRAQDTKENASSVKKKKVAPAQ